MTGNYRNTMIRELSDDELILVAGAKPMERQATRYLAPTSWAEGVSMLLKNLFSDPDIVSTQEVTCTNITYDDGSADFSCRPK